MADGSPFSLDFQPGVQRDGTALDAKRYLDQLWCRYRLGRPRKMKGYRQLSDMLSGTPRKFHCFYVGSQIIVHVGTTLGLQQIIINIDGTVAGIADRTPSTFVGGLDVSWTLDALFNTSTGVVTLVAHAVTNIDQVAGNIQTTPFLGQIDLQNPLVPFSDPGLSDGSTYTQPKVAGGIFCVQPYVMDFDNGGFVGWSAPLLPNTLGITGGTSTAGQTRVSAQKIVAGQALRGGGVQSPAGLLWSLSEVIGFSFVGSTAMGAPTWAFQTISPSSSILAGATVIEYDGLYFWAGVDRFLVFNGTVNELPNTQNQDWFFDNLNRAYAGRSFAFKIPRFGEIWFCAPLFGATDPSHAAIYNIRENYWYDTVLPNGGRGAGITAQGFPYPLMGGVTNDGDGYSLWMHETGLDQVNLVGGPTAIRSYFESSHFGGPKNDPPSNEGISVQMFEPDLEQTGDMIAKLIQQANARSPEHDGQTYPIPQTPTINEQVVGFKQTSRLNRIHIESNVLGGNYICGRNLLHGAKSDARITSG